LRIALVNTHVETTYLYEWYLGAWDRLGLEIVRGYVDDADYYHLFHASTRAIDPALAMALTTMLDTHQRLVVTPIYQHVSQYVALDTAFSLFATSRTLNLDKANEWIQLQEQGIRLNLQGIGEVAPNDPAIRELDGHADSRTQLQQILHYADFVLFHSAGEMAAIAERWGFVSNRQLQLPYPILKSTWVESAGESYVLFIGNLVPQENLLTLLWACKELALPIMVAPFAEKFDANYAALCKIYGDSFSGCFWHLEWNRDSYRKLSSSAKILVNPGAPSHLIPYVIAMIAQGKTAVLPNLMPFLELGPAVYFCDIMRPTSLIAALAAAWAMPIPRDAWRLGFQQRDELLDSHIAVAIHLA